MSRIASKKLIIINYKKMNQLITSKNKKKTLKYLNYSKRLKKKEIIYNMNQLNSTIRRCWNCKNKNMDQSLTRYLLHTKNQPRCFLKSVISMQLFIITSKLSKSSQVKANKENTPPERLLALFRFQIFTSHKKTSQKLKLMFHAL